MDSFVWTLKADSSLETELLTIIGSVSKALDKGIKNAFGPFIGYLNKFMGGDFLGDLLRIQTDLNRITLRMGKTRQEVQLIQESTYKMGQNIGIAAKVAEEYAEAMIKGRIPTKDIQKLGENMAMFEEITGAARKSVVSFASDFMKMKNVSKETVTSMLTSMAQMQKSLGLTKEGMDSVLTGSKNLLLNIKAIAGNSKQLNSMTKAIMHLASTFEKAGMEASEASKIMSNMFNSSNYEKFLPLMAKLGYSASNYSDIISGASSIQEGFTKKLQDLGEETERLMKTSPIAAKAFVDAWTGGEFTPEQLIRLKEVRENEKKVSDSLKEMFGASADTIGRSVTRMHSFVENFLKGLASKLIPVLEHFFKKIEPLIKKIPWEQITNKMTKFVDKMVNFITHNDWDTIRKKLGESILKGIEKLSPILIGTMEWAFNKLKEYLPKILNAITNGIKAAAPFLLKMLKTAFSTLIDIVKETWKRLHPVAKTILILAGALKATTIAWNAYKGLKMVGAATGITKGAGAAISGVGKMIAGLGPVIPWVVGAVLAAGTIALITRHFLAHYSVKGVNDRLKEISNNLDKNIDEIKSNNDKIVEYHKKLSNLRIKAEVTPDEKQKRLIEKQIRLVEGQSKLLEGENKLLIKKTEFEAKKSEIYAIRATKQLEKLTSKLNIKSDVLELAKELKLLDKTRDGFKLNLSKMKELSEKDKERIMELQALNKLQIESLPELKKLVEISDKFDLKGFAEEALKGGAKGAGLGSIFGLGGIGAGSTWGALTGSLKKIAEGKAFTIEGEALRDLKEIFEDMGLKDSFKEIVKGDKVGSGQLKQLINLRLKSLTAEDSVLQALENQNKKLELDQILNKTSNNSLNIIEDNTKASAKSNEDFEQAQPAIWGVEKGAFVVQQEAKNVQEKQLETSERVAALLEEFLGKITDVQKEQVIGNMKKFVEENK